MIKAYLIGFNLLSAFGWAFLFGTVTKSVKDGVSAGDFWRQYGLIVQLVQSLAIFEVIHAAVRMVRSSPMAVLPQVASRLVCVWFWPHLSVAAASHWSLYLMLASWCLVEVPRYVFYATELLGLKISLLKWVRYSEFLVLYPTGISGEVIQLLKALPELKANYPFIWYLGVIGLVLYIPGSPFMYKHMMRQRKKALGGSAPARRPMEVNGISYPKNAKGIRSSTELNRGTWAASAKAVDQELGNSIEREKNWRFKYNKWAVKSVIRAAQSKEDCLKMARAGVDHIHKAFEFVRDGKVMSVADAMNTIKGTYETGFIKGQKSKPSNFEYVVPYKGKNLKRQELKDQVDEWVKYGTIEQSAGDAIKTCVDNPHTLDLSDKYFVLLGAGSAMGPLLVLLELGANVVAIDLNRAGIWKRLIGLARDSCGTMTFPLTKPQTEIATDEELFECAGTNLFTHTPEVGNWLKDLYPSEKFIVGAYAYLDGALFVQVSVAMDAVIEKLQETRKDTSVAYLCTPTDCHFIPKEAHDAMKTNLKNIPIWQRILLSLGILKKNPINVVKAKDGSEFRIIDSLIVDQGPNYALAKRLQHWRAMLTRDIGGVASSNVAPSTSTVSVVKNKNFAAAYKAMKFFKPMEIFAPETSNAVMSALLIQDNRDKSSPSHPSYELKNPYELFSHGGFHGGNWRCAFGFGDLGLVAGGLGYLMMYKTYLYATAAVLMGFTSLLVAKGAPHKW